MKLLLDECLPRKLKDGLLGHDCHTVPEEGWAGKKTRRTPVVSRNSRLSDCSDTRSRPCISTELAGTSHRHRFAAGTIKSFGRPVTKNPGNLKSAFISTARPGHTGRLREWINNANADYFEHPTHPGINTCSSISTATQPHAYARQRAARHRPIADHAIVLHCSEWRSRRLLRPRSPTIPNAALRPNWNPLSPHAWRHANAADPR